MRYSLVELAPIAPDGDRRAALEQALTAAEDAERAGYHRIWFGEHPAALSYASHDPAILITAALSRTSRIRLGSGAVLLNHYSAFSVAQRFLSLEALAPGRIDLGLGRANSRPVVDYALRPERSSTTLSDFVEQVQEVVGHLHHAFAPDHPFAAIDLTVGVDGAPAVWVLGSSGHTAEVAGRLGVGYSFGGHINPAMIEPALDRYRSSFRATPFGTGEPQVVLGLNIVAAEEDDLAHRLTWPARALRSGGRDRPIPTLAQATDELDRAEKQRPSAVCGAAIPAQIAGTPESLRQQLEPLIRTAGAAEVVVHDMLTDFELRRRSRELIAGVFAGILPPGEEDNGPRTTGATRAPASVVSG
jgi:luciferase family oxidoreductase group 1